ncbi:hypothetical protein L596_009896 [Steinernema carpocapsae]|uniref:Uncharacterized protein n=1 Tax=Steinernema carpocapsae TaxID=34508 RepID=A0A4U5PGP3_STECR|nr:hypothetical protein L596_009896 [Steinernema carpocapsae]
MDSLPHNFISSAIHLASRSSLSEFSFLDSNLWKSVAENYVYKCKYYEVIVGANSLDITASIYSKESFRWCSLQGFKAAITPYTRVSMVSVCWSVTQRHEPLVTGTADLQLLVQCLKRLPIAVLSTSKYVKLEDLENAAFLLEIPARQISIGAATPGLLNYHLLENPNLIEVHVYRMSTRVFLWKLTESWKRGVKQELLEEIPETKKSLEDQGFKFIKKSNFYIWSAHITGVTGKSICFFAH